MLLHKLLEQFDSHFSLNGIPNVAISGIQEDSRLVQAGDLFIARLGLSTDGAKYVTDAANRGAVAVVTERPLPDCTLPQVVMSDVAQAAYRLADCFFDHPCNDVTVLGITGTNGKTTTAYLIQQILAKSKQRCGLIGTVEIDDGRTRRPAAMTTPSPTEIARLFAAMRDQGCRRCAIEVSSHALQQGRVNGVRFAGAAFTNLTGDHLDYHKTMDLYADAKARLFAMLDDYAVAVTNADKPWSRRMERDCKARIVRYGFGEDADYRARDCKSTAMGTHFVLATPDGQTDVHMALIGRHNIENALAAAALLQETLGLSVHQIAAGLASAAGAPGRLQKVRARQRFAVLVDYAHTDDALENVLRALRELMNGRGQLRVLFGCGGNRDTSKRQRMAHVAERLADVIYVTSDNPRTEDPREIVDQICQGFSESGRRRVVIDIDRRAAIEHILADARPGDVVLLAGKGHEDYQIIGQEKRHFDDVEEATRVLTGLQRNETT